MFTLKFFPFLVNAVVCSNLAKHACGKFQEIKCHGTAPKDSIWEKRDLEDALMRLLYAANILLCPLCWIMLDLNNYLHTYNYIYLFIVYMHGV